MRSAQLLHRADQALRLPCSANRCAEVHHTLCVSRHVFGGRQQFAGFVPQHALRGSLRQVRRISQHAGQHALDVAVQYGHALTETKRGHRRRRRATNSGQGLQGQGRCRELAAMIADHLLRAAVQISRARVIAQTTPQAQHLVQLRRSQRANVGEALQKAGVIVQYRAHLCLLEHDL